MQLQQVLTAMTGQAQSDHKALYLNGAIAVHDQTQSFRLYPDAMNPRKYYVVDSNDVTGDLHEWTASELAHANFAGQKRYRIPLKFHAVVEFVTVEIHRLGETVAGDTDATQSLSSDCRSAPGCGGNNPCCTSTNGGPCYCDTCCVS